MKKQIAVTGAAGFVGRNLLPYLIENGFGVLAIVKNEQEKCVIEKLPIKIIVADLSKSGKWQEHLEADVIVHLASEISSKNKDDFYKNNVVATKNLIKAAKKSKVKNIIHFSSAAVTSIRQDPYSKTKKEQEDIVTCSKIPFLILRPSMMYGPTDDKNIGWLIKTLKKLPIIPLPGGGYFGRQPIYISDICQIILKMINGSTINKIYEIHGYEYVSMREMVKVIKAQFNIKNPVIIIPVVFLKLFIIVNQLVSRNPKFTIDQIESLISGEKFKGDDWAKIFDIMPTKFSDGIKKMNGK